jgi:hypothetical protein
MNFSSLGPEFELEFETAEKFLITEFQINQVLLYIMK